MKLFSKKLDIVTLIAIVVMAMSLSLLDFSDLSWNNNIKAYIGLIFFVLLVALKYYGNYRYKS